MRGCLMMIGFVLLLGVTACVVNIGAARRALNPTQFSRLVDETPEKTRRMMTDFLEFAANEPAGDRLLGDRPSDLKVQDFTDGSVHLTLDSRGARLMVLAVTFKPHADGGTLVEVFSDAKALGEAARPRVAPPVLHRQIQADLSGALAAIDGHRVLPGGLLVSRLITRARDARKQRW